MLYWVKVVAAAVVVSVLVPIEEISALVLGIADATTELLYTDVRVE